MITESEESAQSQEVLHVAMKRQERSMTLTTSDANMFGEFAYTASRKLARTVCDEPIDWMDGLDDEAVLGLWKQNNGIHLCAMKQYGEIIGRTRRARLPDNVQALTEKGVEVVASAQNLHCSHAYDPLKALTVRPKMPFAQSVGIDDACRELNIGATADHAEALARIFVEGRFRLWW